MPEQLSQINTPVSPLPAVAPQKQTSVFRTASRVSYILLDILEGLLLLRVAFKLFSANQAVSIVRLIYSATDIFVAPFRQFFVAGGVADLILEFGTLAAMVFYAIVVYLLVELLLFFSKNKNKTP